MAWFNRKDPSLPSSSPGWEIARVTGYVQSAAPNWEHRDVEPALIEARLADHMRDEHLPPPAIDDFATLVAKFDQEGWRRFALAVGAFEQDEIRHVLTLVVNSGITTQSVLQGMVNLSDSTDVLSLELLGQSEMRAEEFARHFASHLGVPIVNESPDESRRKLERLDYRRLLAEAERARGSAEEKLAYLRKLQQSQDAGRRRGKW